MGLMRTQAEDHRIRLAKPSVSMPTFNSGSVTGKVEFDPDVMGGSARWSVTLTSNLTVVSSTGGAAKAAGMRSAVRYEDGSMELDVIVSLVLVALVATRRLPVGRVVLEVRRLPVVAWEAWSRAR